MFNKILLLPLVAISTTTLFVPSIVLAKPSQSSMAASANLNKDKLEIKKVIEKNINSINAGDSAGYLRTLSPSSTEYQKTIQNPGNIRIVKGFGLIFNVQQLDYLQVSSNQAEVQVKILMTISKTGLLSELEKLQQSGTKIGKDGSITTTSVKTSSNFNKSQVSVGNIKLGRINGQWLITAMSNDKNKSMVGSRNSNISATPVASQPIQPIVPSPKDRKIFQQVFAKHLSALNQEKLGDYLATLDSTSPNYSAAKASTLKLFKNYDLKYELKNVEVLSLSKQEAVVKLIANVKKIKGGEFTDSQLVTINTVRKTNGQWRIYDTQVENISALNTPKAKIAKR